MLLLNLWHIVQVSQLFVPRKFQEKYYFWYYDTYVDTEAENAETTRKHLKCESKLRAYLKEVNKTKNEDTSQPEDTSRWRKHVHENKINFKVAVTPCA